MLFPFLGSTKKKKKEGVGWKPEKAIYAKGE